MKDRAISLIKSLYLSNLRCRKVAITVAIAMATLGFSAVAIAAIVSGAPTSNVSNHVTYTQLTLNVPTQAAGDVMVASLAIKGGSAAVMVTVPSGWTQIARTDNDTNVTLISYYKIASGSSEPGSYTWTIQDQTRAGGGITDYSGVDTINPIATFSANTGRGRIATTSAITTAHPGEEIIALYSTDVGTTSASGYFLAPTTTSMTQKYNVSNAALGPSIAAFDASQASPGSTGSIASATGDNKVRDWATQAIALNQTPTVTTNPMTVSSSTLALWSMNGSAGTFAKEADDGPNGLNLLEVNSPTSGTGWTTPTTDGAYILDGSSQFLTASDTGLVTGNGARTVEAWVYRNDGSDAMLANYGAEAPGQEWVFAILNSGSGNLLYTQNNSQDNCRSTAPVSVGAWHYVAETYDGATVNFYIDGNSAGACTYHQASNTTLNGAVTLGVYNNVINHEYEDFLNGAVDQVKFSSGAKSATEACEGIVCLRSILPSQYPRKSLGAGIKLEASD
jgi:hypothetical protein